MEISSYYMRFLGLLSISLLAAFYFFTSGLANQSPELLRKGGKPLDQIDLVAILPERFKPSKNHHNRDRRLIFIGDVHGAYDELVSLLEKVKYNSKTDHIVFLGDLVSKGPHSLKVVKLAMKMGASAVIGNHDYDLLGYMGLVKPLDNNDEKKPSKTDAAGQFIIGSKEQIASNFEHEAAEWMLKSPFILRVGEIDGKELVAVHGGLQPDKALDEQDPWAVMNMRNIHNGIPSKKTHKGRPWAEEWNDVQDHLSHPTTVIYGHDARRGLQIRKYTKGLDTCCVRGGELTALIYPGEKLVSVKCQKYYD